MVSPAAGPRYGSPQQIATFTGLSTRTVRRLYSKRQLIAHKIDRRVLIAFEDAEHLVRRSSLTAVPSQVAVPSALTTEGRAISYSAAECRARVRVALDVLDHLAVEEPDDDDDDQVEALAQLCQNLQANRGEP